MPNFSFAPIIKPSKAKSTSQTASKYNIIIADIEGIVFINLKGEYSVVIGNDKYSIASESYSCKGVSEIYEKDLINDITRSRFIRSERDRDDRDRNMYLPFTAGCTVKGNIVRHKAAMLVLFKIKKVFIDIDNSIGKEAIKFYRDNYKKIKKHLNTIIEDDLLINYQKDIDNTLLYTNYNNE